MPLNTEQIRHELLVLARRKACRILGWPRDWRPNQVIEPGSGQPFTAVGAWEFIVGLLEDGVEIQPKTLDDGKSAYVMLAPLGDKVLYVKLQLGNGRVIGRSFHYSEKDHSSREYEPKT